MRKDPISWSAINKNPMLVHFFECIPLDEGTTRRGPAHPCIFWKILQVPHTARQVTCYLVNNSRGKLSFISPQNTRPDSPVPTLQES